MFYLGRNDELCKETLSVIIQFLLCGCSGFSLVGGTGGGSPPMSLMSPLIRTVSPPIKSESCPPSSPFIMGGTCRIFLS